MATTKKKTFRAILGGESGQRPSLELPFDVRATYGTARPKVKVTVIGVELRTTVAVYGGRAYVGFREEVRTAAGIAIGDELEVTVEPDTEERVVEVPPDLAAALADESPLTDQIPRGTLSRSSWSSAVRMSALRFALVIPRALSSSTSSSRRSRSLVYMEMQITL